MVYRRVGTFCIVGMMVGINGCDTTHSSAVKPLPYAFPLKGQTLLIVDGSREGAGFSSALTRALRACGTQVNYSEQYEMPDLGIIPTLSFMDPSIWANPNSWAYPLLKIRWEKTLLGRGLGEAEETDFAAQLSTSTLGAVWSAQISLGSHRYSDAALESQLIERLRDDGLIDPSCAPAEITHEPYHHPRSIAEDPKPSIWVAPQAPAAIAHPPSSAGPSAQDLMP